MYFNMKYERTGKLFEGAFKATHIDSDEYLKYLFAYIHLNPVKLFEKHWKEYGIGDRLGAKHYLEQYTHSSYSDYLGSKREEGYILNQQAFPEYFSETATFEAFVDDWLQFLDLTEVSPQGGRETA